MTILAVSSSPRRNGNSELALAAFLEGMTSAREGYQVVRLNSLHFRPCQACDGCQATGKCIVKDDMQELYKLVADCSALLLATPIYFGTLSAQLKMFIDRFQCWWFAKYRLKMPPVPAKEKRPAFFICTGALKKEQYALDADRAVRLFLQNINFSYRGGLCFQGVDEKGAINRSLSYPEQARAAGTRFYEDMGKAVSGKASLQVIAVD